MDFDQIIEEIYDSGGGSYSASSEAPRKDFAPMSSKAGYNNPYQRDGVYGNLTEPPPDAPESMPWPLQTVTTDVADSFVYLMTAMNKMSQCVKQNPSLTKEAKKELLELYKKSKQALGLLRDVGLSINKLNIAGAQPSQNPIPNTPDQRINPGSIPNINTTIAIKIPRR
jgi:hypothetical protein